MKSPIPIVRIVLLSVISFCPWLYGQNVPDADFRGIWTPCNKFSDTAAVPAGTVLFQDLYFDGKPGQVKNASLLLELPVDMPLIRYRDTRAAQLKAPSELIDHGRVTRDGRAYHAYEITLRKRPSTATWQIHLVAHPHLGRHGRSAGRLDGHSPLAAQDRQRPDGIENLYGHDRGHPVIGRQTQTVLTLHRPVSSPVSAHRP